jgi:eukaryotic-like serine/threonine-protein kinase
VIRGSASPGAEFAALQFTNIGATSCTLYGYPAVTLLLKGSRIGTPSQPATTSTSRMTLRPGDTAESKLNDYTNCQAPLSDSIRVVAPGSTIHAVRPGQLRACILRVSKLGVPD